MQEEGEKWERKREICDKHQTITLPSLQLAQSDKMDDSGRFELEMRVLFYSLNNLIL